VTREIGKRTLVTMMYVRYPAFPKGGLKIGDEASRWMKLSFLKSAPKKRSSHAWQVGTSVSLTVKRYGVKDPIRIEFKRRESR